MAFALLSDSQADEFLEALGRGAPPQAFGGARVWAARLPPTPAPGPRPAREFLQVWVQWPGEEARSYLLERTRHTLGSGGTKFST